jgi:hypothetical protein
MTCKVMLSEGLGECVSNLDLVLCVDREYLDESLVYMFMKVMVADNDMFCFAWGVEPVPKCQSCPQRPCSRCRVEYK